VVGPGGPVRGGPHSDLCGSVHLRPGIGPAPPV